MEKTEFEKQYGALQKVDQEILQVIALIYEPSRITYLLRCITACGLLTDLPKKEQFNFIKELESRILIHSESKYFIDRSIMDFFLKEHCLKNPNFENYRSVISRIFPLDEKKTRYRYGENPFHMDRIVRDFRISFFLSDRKSLEDVFKVYEKAVDGGKNDRYKLYLGLFNAAFSTDLIQQVPDEYKLKILENFYVYDDHHSALEVVSYMAENANSIKDTLVRTQMVDMLANAYFERGELEKLAQLIKNKEVLPGFYLPSIEFLQGNITKAKEHYISEIYNILGRSKRRYCPPRIHGVYFCLTMLATHDFQNPLLHAAINKGTKENRSIYQVFQAYIASNIGDETYLDKQFDSRSFTGFMDPIACLLLWMTNKKLISADHLKSLRISKNYAQKMNCHYLIYQCHTVLTIIDKKYNVSLNEKTEYARLAKKYLDLSTLFKKEEEWKKSFKILKSIAAGSKNKIISKAHTERLIWLVRHYGSNLSFYPKEQVIGKNGKWSKGRPVALKRIMLCDVSCMSPIDKQIASCISEERISTWGRYYEIQFLLDTERALPFFLNHPLLFLHDSPTTPVELLKEDPQLIVKKKRHSFEISLSHPIEGKGMQVIRETPSRFKVLKINDLEKRIAKVLGKKNKLVIPRQETESELKQIMSGLSTMITIHSDIKGGDTKIISIKADPKPHIHLLPVGEGIRCELFVRPFKTTGQFCKPGQGGKTIMTEIKGTKKQAIRNLAKEKESAATIISQCPSLAVRGNYDDVFNFETPEECLEALLDLQEVKDDIIIEWPEGETLKVRRKFSLSDMNVAIIKSDDWFEMNASLQVDNHLVLTMQELLKRASHSRFIELSNGEFIALTRELRHMIEELSTYSYASKGKSKIHPLNVLAIDELLTDINTQFDQHWEAQLKKAEASLSFQPQLPSTLQAELRPYQREGYIWLSRLANWGVGACLADDMGLGKTIQALAIILERAVGGPTLVVAPASVCINWISEANRFAPTLNPILFGADDRKEVLQHLKPFDLVVCSYGLLIHESNLISEVQWSTTVLDEAQAIKNFKAKRTQAALYLKSEFKLITTGTPIENHLSEFWSLFNFINPGLLGSQQEFAAKFALPIEREHDDKMRNTLKKTVRPFLLRRTKAQVLDELPPKTEINLSIELSEEESAFYEALRRNSVAQIESMKNEKSGTVHLQILAELTKLRRACCHPALIKKEAKIESSKLSMFVDIVNELIENKHKVLVFSQFTGYLAFIRDTCERIGIDYQYLDGSTPIKERQTRIDAFQAGQGDIFLISLKAGGVGLNLTAADYVIHMDPWWNPAVEDQASDRAHRIGQQHPVTVYRFVTKGTVEEKIIALHKSKRELVHSLLDGADVSGKMSAVELLSLIK